MSVEITRLEDAPVYRNPGKVSLQVVCPQNSPGAQVTITRVTMAPGAVSGLHSHAASEQTWIIEKGSGKLLLAGDRTRPITEGAVVRTPPTIEHGIRNTGSAELVYLSITTPPEDMAKFYDEHQS